MSTENKGSSKFDQAVNRARGGAPTGNAEAPSIPMKAHALVSTISQDEVNAMMNSGEFEFAPQVLSMEEGQMVAGILEGNGPDAEITDPQSGEVRPVPTWIIATPDGSARVSILSSAQLEKKLPPFIGGHVRIVRGKDLKTSNNRRVTDYLVAGPKLPNGKLRNFTHQRVIDTTEAKALPAAVIAQANHAQGPNAEDLA